ncbi:hypothetical protein NP284_21335 [Rhodopseudomonas pseudopalustris]|uniref:Uncharacterized protein n=2 Tax=Rhodopseudomonas pseudopalustris TaxID=1513892 RepID=A0A1H8WI79_9BRAD|nr:hypothetical protein SAMN05444123_112107 [Rhodopseudomonas pseudopalustris]
MNCATEQSVLNAQWNAACAACAAEDARRAPHVLMRPALFPDGDMWCALYGENLQEGVAGFGATPAAAMEQFDWAWRNEQAAPAEACADAEVRSETVLFAAAFLLARLQEFDPGDFAAEREFNGHVAPAMARLKSAIEGCTPTAHKQ